MESSWRKLVEDHLWLVDVVACHFVVDAMDREELRSVGFEALVIAAMKYQPRGASFHTYARLCIRGNMLNWLAMPSTVVVDEATLTVLSPPITTQEDAWRHVVDWSLVSALEELVLWCLYPLGLTHVETARELGLKVLRVREIEREAITCLRETI